jgi:hypothetical protein
VPRWWMLALAFALYDLVALAVAAVAASPFNSAKRARTDLELVDAVLDELERDHPVFADINTMLAELDRRQPPRSMQIASFRPGSRGRRHKPRSRSSDKPFLLYTRDRAQPHYVNLTSAVSPNKTATPEHTGPGGAGALMHLLLELFVIVRHRTTEGYPYPFGLRRRHDIIAGLAVREATATAYGRF